MNPFSQRRKNIVKYSSRGIEAGGGSSSRVFVCHRNYIQKLHKFIFLEKQNLLPPFPKWDTGIKHKKNNPSAISGELSVGFKDTFFIYFFY